MLPSALARHSSLARNSSPHDIPGFAMDKKAKKKIDVLRTRVHKLQLQVAGAKKQMDDADELARLEKELASAEAELNKLKDS
jgi:hypothetical protein